MAVGSFSRQVENWGIAVSDDQRETLLAYTRELAAYKKANVIGTRNADEIFMNHVLDSLSCFIYAPLRQTKSLIDVGSGGGVPGLPIKILNTQMKATLVEATGKKVDFLRYVIEKLSLTGVEVLNARVEELGRNVGYRGRYDAATVRAVARLDVILEYCIPLLKRGGSVVSMKGPLDLEELAAGKRAAGLLGAEVTEIVEIPFLPDMPDKKRKLVVAHKISNTPERYPRKNGVPKKDPLGEAKK